jgi:rhodanese-related sulfurtransferase
MRERSYKLLSWYIVLTAALVTAGNAACKPASSTSNMSDITVQEAYNLIQDNLDNTDFVIIDIRTPQEYADGYIEGAINVDFYAADFEQQLDQLDKNEIYLVYCRSANRSGQAMPVFERLGFTTVYNMLGGIVQWEAD